MGSARDKDRAEGRAKGSRRDDSCKALNGKQRRFAHGRRGSQLASRDTPD